MTRGGSSERETPDFGRRSGAPSVARNEMRHAGQEMVPLELRSQHRKASNRRGEHQEQVERQAERAVHEASWPGMAPFGNQTER